MILITSIMCIILTTIPNFTTIASDSSIEKDDPPDLNSNINDTAHLGPPSPNFNSSVQKNGVQAETNLRPKNEHPPNVNIFLYF